MSVDPRATAFKARQAELEPSLRATTPAAWVMAMARRRDLSAGERELLAKVQAEPDAYEIRSGAPREKPGWLAKNWPYLAVGGAIAAPYVMGAAGALGGGGAAAATGGAGATTAGTAATAAGGAGMASSFWSPSTLRLLELGIGTGTNVWNARTQSRALRDSAVRDAAANAESMAYLRDRDAHEDQQYLEERSRRWTQEDDDRRMYSEDRATNQRLLNEREGRLAPMRTGSGAYQTLNQLARLTPRTRRPGGTLRDLAAVS